MSFGITVLIIEDHEQKDWKYSTMKESEGLKKYIIGDKDGVL